MATKNHVDTYCKGTATIEVNFYDGITDCRHCPFIGTNSILDACYCKLTGTYVDKKWLSRRASDCPTVFKEED